MLMSYCRVCKYIVHIIHSLQQSMAGQKGVYELNMICGQYNIWQYGQKLQMLAQLKNKSDQSTPIEQGQVYRCDS